MEPEKHNVGTQSNDLLLDDDAFNNNDWTGETEPKFTIDPGKTAGENLCRGLICRSYSFLDLINMLNPSANSFKSRSEFIKQQNDVLASVSEADHDAEKIKLDKEWKELRNELAYFKIQLRNIGCAHMKQQSQTQEERDRNAVLDSNLDHFYDAFVGETPP